MSEGIESEALEIARWCWPDKQWTVYGDREVVGSPGGVAFGTYELDEVLAAELIVIARGYASEYGRALFDNLCNQPEERPDDDCTLLGLEEMTAARAYWHDVAIAAAAPLSARVSALLAVVRNNKA